MITENKKLFYKVSKAIEKQKKYIYKLLYIGTAKWANARTCRVEEAHDLYILGFESSCKPILVNEIVLHSDEVNLRFVLNRHLYHINISETTTEKEIFLVLDGKAYEVTMYGQEFCNPITAYDVLNRDEKEVRGLIKANLLSQNDDDAFANIYSVSNTEIDMILQGGYVLNSSPLRLMVPETSDDNIIFERLREIKKVREKDVWAKAKGNDRYDCYSKEYYRQNRSEFSDYYPVFDKKFIDKLDIKAPKEEYDIGVYGLGSAGTAVLDTLCRSNWVKSIYLCDFDIVEDKNIINQWYTQNNVGGSKVTESANKIRDLQRDVNGIITKFTVNVDRLKFEDSSYKNKKFKYVVSGFDSIKTRQKFFAEIENGNIETQFLIDCRYLDLASSIYIIDTSNKEQMEFYKANLDADAEAFENASKTEMLSQAEFDEMYDKIDVPHGNCRKFEEKLGFDNFTCGADTCGTKECRQWMYEYYRKHGKPVVPEAESSCVKQNYIDIYKYAGSIIFGTVRKIENNEPKPFTLLEAETNIKGLPNYMIVKE